MKAIVCTKYGSPEVLKLSEVVKPIPKDNEVLIKIYATTVTAGDTRIRAFRVPLSFWIPARIALGIRKPKNPILGMELSGVIESIGKDVKNFKVGDSVYGICGHDCGAYADYKCIRYNGIIAIKPSNLSFEEAAAIPVGARTAIHYLRKANILSQQNTLTGKKKVLIYGASGSVGSYAIQLAKHFGAEVTGVCSTANLEMVKELGANKVIDYTKENFSKIGETYDVVLETVNKSSFLDCVQSLKKNGIYMNVTEPFPSFKMLWTSLTTRKKIILGELAAKNADDLYLLRELIEAGKIKPFIDKHYSLEQIVEAHSYVDEGHKKGNVVITVNNVLSS